MTDFAMITMIIFNSDKVNKGMDLYILGGSSYSNSVFAVIG